jgi:hypothetical protein
MFASWKVDPRYFTSGEGDEEGRAACTNIFTFISCGGATGT